MKHTSVGARLFLSVVTIFLFFFITFIIIQQEREHESQVRYLHTRLQDYNRHMEEMLSMEKDTAMLAVEKYVSAHPLPNLRVTIIASDGSIIYDNIERNTASMANHLNRKEVEEALAKGHGHAISRKSKTLGRSYFYSATYFPHRQLIIRTALPYGDTSAEIFEEDNSFLWFSLFMIVILCFVLYHFTSRLGKNISNLRRFAYKADHNQSLNHSDIAGFPDDELGEIAERIVKIYKRLEHTRGEQQRLKRELTQNIAHELKTPIASIMGYLETMKDNPQMAETTRQQFIERSYNQARRLTSLLQDISTLNRMDDAPVTEHNIELTDINAIVARIQNETNLQLQQKRMTFCNQLPDNIRVEGVPSLLYSIFRNLTDNAINYSGEGTTILLTAESTASEFIFRFSDNGIGVPPEHLSRIFERFYRIDKGRSREMGGTGLGLAIVKNAVILHGGQICASNASGGGLVFEFSLRREKSEE